MACDKGLVERIRESLRSVPGVDERRMFGGVCFTLHGNMVCGVVKDDLMVRVGPAAHAAALARPHAREMDFTGKPMRGYVFVGIAGLAEDDDLRAWIDAGRAFVGRMPPKQASRPAKSKGK